MIYYKKHVAGGSVLKLKGLPLNSAIVRFAGVMLLSLALPFTIVLLMTTNRLSAMERENANQYLSSNLKTVSTTVDQVLRNLEFSHTTMFQDKQFLNGIKKLASYDTREEYSDFKNTTGIKSCINGAAATNDYIDSIYAYSFTAGRFFSSKTNWDPSFNHFDEANSKWLQTYLSNDPTHPWYITGEIKDGKLILSSYRGIWVYGKELPIGLLSVNVDASDITRMLTEVTPDSSGYTFIIDGQGNVISEKNERDDAFQEIIRHMPPGLSEGYFDFRFGARDIFASFYTSPYSGFKYVTATPLDQIQTSVPVMIQLIALFLLLLVLMAILAMLFAHHYFYTPIKSLFAGMKRLEDGDFATQLPENPTYEFNYINRNFNHMVESIRKLINENYANKLVNKEAQLRNLQNQLNEHFLYNTLDSIHWLARIENAPQVCDMVFALANFYRLSLSSGKDVISVQDVIKTLENYLYIQKFRMRNTLNYSIDCEPALLNQPILKNLLQPVVENAIIHGITGLNRPGMIEIRFNTYDGWMRVIVKDNGHGFTDDKLGQVREQLDLQDPYCEHSFALKTVQSQLQIFYGFDISIYIETLGGNGTTVWFDLPVTPTGGDVEDAENDHC